MNADSDGYATGALGGCPPALDCDDSTATVNPSEFEVVGDGVDSDCDGRDALRRYLSTSFFSSATWTPSGTVSFPAGNLKVGDGSAAASSAKRTYNLARTSGATGIMVDIDDLAGPACSVTVTTGVGGGPGTPYTQSLGTAATTVWLELGEVIVPHTLRDVEFDCPDAAMVEVDWLVVQNAELVFPPSTELSIDWHDTRTPGGGWTTSIVRDDDTQWLYMGSDVAGVARHDGTGSEWETAFGAGTATFAPGGVMAVADILPEPAGNVVYALVGDVERGKDDVDGGLWYSSNRGNTWSQVADSFSATWDDDSDTYLDYPPEDDVAGFPLLSQCPATAEATKTTWVSSGGRHLQADWFLAGEVVYIGNDDPDARGVSVYTEATGETCPLAHTGDALPAEPVGAVLRVDVQPSGDPVLVVGYDARPDGEPGVFVCTLPAGGMDCTGATSAYCFAVAESAGVDVRDLQRDLRFQESRVFVADGGFRPEDVDNDGLVDEACSVVDPGVDELVLEDIGYIDYTYARVAEAADLPSTDALSVEVPLELTGLSMDPGAGFLFANVPANDGANYETDRMYRVDLDDLAPGFEWTAVNDGDGVTSSIHDEDAREAIRRANTDVDATWLGQSIAGVPAVFPARDAPGAGIDTTWLDFDLFPAISGVAVVASKSHAWRVLGLADAWSDDDTDGNYDSEEETGWLFWPGVNTGERQTYQTMAVTEVAVTPAGEVFQSVGDHGLAYLDPASTPQSSTTPNSSEIDCLWTDGFKAGGNSVDVGLDGSVWVALRDQSVNDANPYPHDGGVLRYADTGGGWAWTFAAGGYEDDLGVRQYNMDDTQPWERLCIDELRATNFITAMDPDPEFVSPFSWQSPDVGQPHIGNPKEVRPLDATTAVVLFNPTETPSAVNTDGGLYATLSGGVDYTTLGGAGAWLPVPFDGAYEIGTTGVTGTCDEATTWNAAHVELIHPGVDTYANDSDLDGVVDDLDSDGYPDDFLLDLLVTVSSGDSTKVAAGGAWYSPCALARVLVGDDGAGGLDATWEWIPLQWHYEPFTSTECAVWGRNIRGATVSPWSNEVFVYGSYYRDPPAGSPASGRRGGGACVLDLDTLGTTLLVSPVDSVANELLGREYSIADVVPHPQVSDLVAILPTLDRATWLQCGRVRDAYSGNYPEPCDYPWPVVAERQGPTWKLTDLATQPPTGLIVDAEWSDIGLPVGEDLESWLVVGTAGSGTWRGVLEW